MTGSVIDCPVTTYYLNDWYGLTSGGLYAIDVRGNVAQTRERRAGEGMGFGNIHGMGYLYLCLIPGVMACY